MIGGIGKGIGEPTLFTDPVGVIVQRTRKALLRVTRGVRTYWRGVD